MASGSIDLGANAITPSGPAGGDLGGNYPNPTVVSIGASITIPLSQTTGSLSLENRVSGNLPLSQTSGSLSLTNRVSGNLPLSQTSGSISLTNQVSGNLPLSQTSGSISLQNQVVDNLPLSQTSGSISLTTQVSGVLPAAQVGIIDITSGTSGSVSLTNKVSGNLPISQTSGSVSLTAQVSGVLPAAQVGVVDITSGTSGSVSLTDKVSGSLPLSQTSGSISLTAQVSGVLPAAQVGVISVTAGTSGSVSLTNKVSGTLGVAQGGTGTSAFTQGSVVFVDGAGVYAENNTSFFWNDATRGLGLNTNSITTGAVLDIEAVGSTSTVMLPRGATNQRPPVGVNGMLRENTGHRAVESYSNQTWGTMCRIVATYEARGQTANIGSTTIFTTSTTCFYAMYATRQVTVRGASSTAPGVIGWTTFDVLGSQGGVAFVPTNTTNLVGTYDPGQLPFLARGGTNIMFSTTGYASTGTAMQYALVIRLVEIPMV